MSKNQINFRATDEHIRMIDETGEPRAKIIRDALDLYFSKDRLEIGENRRENRLDDGLDRELPIDKYLEPLAQIIKSEMAPLKEIKPLIENSTRTLQTAMEANKPQTPVQIVNKFPQPQDLIEYYPKKVRKKKKWKFWRR